MKYSRLTGLLISLVFIIFIHYLVGWKSIFKTWQTLGPTQFFIALGLIFSSYLLRSLRLYMHCYETLRTKGLLAIKVHIQHNFYNNFLPMRAGEFSFPILMKRHFGLSYAKSAGVLLWFRALDLQVLALLTLSVLFTLGAINKWLLCTAFIFILASPIILLTPPLQRLLRSQKPNNQINGNATNDGSINKPSFKQRMADALHTLKTGLPQNKRSFWVGWWLTLANWGLKILVFAWILQFFHAMEFSVAIMGAIGGEATSLLPIHGFAGIGSYEAGIAGSLLIFGQSEHEILIAAVNLHIMLIVSTMASMVLSMLIKNESTKA